MKALIQKELRENLKLAVLGLIIFALLLWSEYHDFVKVMADLTPDGPNVRDDLLQPLIAPLTLLATGFFCAIFGAVLGWFQIHREGHRDLWAFLIHRPITRTGIFLGKIVAGLTLYVLVAGLPLVCFVAWARVPGHVAAPFQWAIMRPLFALFLGGIVYYFAGMLIAFRQEIRYASRALGLGLAFLVSLAICNWPFRASLAFTLISGVILATAVWGGFHSHGQYRGQPTLGKLALTAALTPGAGLVVFVAAFVLVILLPNRLDSILPGWIGTTHWSNYVMTKDGAIYKVTGGYNRPTEIVDLDGKPFIDAKSGRMVGREDVNQRAADTFLIDLDFGKRRPEKLDPHSLFTFWQVTHGTIWYYWNRYGRFVGYDLVTRRLVGSLGPNGFANNLSGSGDRFSGNRFGDDRFNSPEEYYNPLVHLRTLQTTTAVYQADLRERTTRIFFATSDDDPIVAVRDISSKGGRWDYTAVVTRRFVHLLTPDGKAVWKAPFEPACPPYNRIRICFLEAPGQFALRFDPSRSANLKAGWKLPTHVTWLARDAGVLKSTDLPVLDRPNYGIPCRPLAVSTLFPPVLWLLMIPYLDVDLDSTMLWIWWKLALISLAAAAVVWVPAGLWLGWRFNFKARAQLGWAVFHLLCGIPGFLAFLSVQEWPAREACPNCKKLRVVDRKKCPHCGADFAPPEKTGTEIFEPLVTAQR